MLYMWLTDSPKSENLEIRATINGTVTAPDSMTEMSGDLKKWSKSTFDLALIKPGFVKLKRATIVSLAINGPVDLSKIPRLLWLSGLSGLLLALLGMYVSYVFMNLFRSLADQHIFDDQQTARLMQIGYSLLLYAGLSFTVERLSRLGAIVYVERFGYSVSEHNHYSIGVGSPSTEAISVLSGLCILALAQVFKYGLRLQRDSELTI